MPRTVLTKKRSAIIKAGTIIKELREDSFKTPMKALLINKINVVKQKKPTNVTNSDEVLPKTKSTIKNKVIGKKATPVTSVNFLKSPFVFRVFFISQSIKTIPNKGIEEAKIKNKCFCKLTSKEESRRNVPLNIFIILRT
jgi:hypothetical protein